MKDLIEIKATVEVSNPGAVQTHAQRMIVEPKFLEIASDEGDVFLRIGDLVFKRV